MFLLLLSLVAADTLNLTLDQALLLARQKSPVSADARLDTLSGQSKYLRGWSGVLPSLSGSGGFGWHNSQNILGNDTTTHAWSFSVGVSQVLFDASIAGAAAQGVVARDVARLQARSKLSELDLNVKTGYFGLQKLYGMYDLADTALARADDDYYLVEQKLRLGKATEIERLRAQVAVHQARLNLMDAEKGILAANETFKAKLGISDNSVVKTEPADTVRPEPGYSTFGSLWQAVQAGNPSLQLAEKNLKLAGLGKKIAYGRLLPSVSARLQNSYSDAGFPSSFKKWGENDATSFGFNLSLPIFDIQGNLLDIRDAGLELERAQVSLRSGELELRQTALGAYLNYAQAGRQVDYAAENLTLNQELHRLAQEQYRLGQVTLFDLLSVETGLVQARVSYLNALSDTRVQQAQLDYLLGR
jgi:outer membrane protein TolC